MSAIVFFAMVSGALLSTRSPARAMQEYGRRVKWTIVDTLTGIASDRLASVEECVV